MIVRYRVFLALIVAGVAPTGQRLDYVATRYVVTTDAVRLTDASDSWADGEALRRARQQRDLWPSQWHQDA